MHTDQVETKIKRLGELLGGDQPSDAEQKEAVGISIELLGGACTNLARIADALDHGLIKVEVCTPNR